MEPLPPCPAARSREARRTFDARSTIVCSSGRATAIGDTLLPAPRSDEMWQMLRLSIPLASLFLAFSCGSSTALSTSEPEIRIEQLPASAFDVQQRGAVSIAYRMTVRNRSTEPITLQQ